MTKSIIFCLIFFIFFGLPKAYALGISITDKALEGYIRYEENRNYGYWFDVSAVGEIQLSFAPPELVEGGGRRGLTIRSGFLFGDMEYSNELKMFASAKASPFSKVPVDFHLYWIYNGLPDLDVYENSLLPTITYNWSRRSFTMGYNTRWTTFWGEETIREHLLVYAYRSDFLKRDSIQMSFILSNYSEFKVNAVTGLTYHLIANVPINDRLMFTGGIELLQSGFLNFVEDVYGLSIKTGVRYKW